MNFEAVEIDKKWNNYQVNDSDKPVLIVFHSRQGSITVKQKQFYTCVETNYNCDK